MKCRECEADGEYGCRAGFTSIIIDGEWGCRDADRLLDAYHFNQVKGDSSTSTRTNADRIRAMTDEELAEWLDNNTCQFPIYKDWLEWLRQEADNG